MESAALALCGLRVVADTLPSGNVRRLKSHLVDRDDAHVRRLLSEVAASAGLRAAASLRRMGVIDPAAHTDLKAALCQGSVEAWHAVMSFSDTLRQAGVGNMIPRSTLQQLTAVVSPRSSVSSENRAREPAYAAALLLALYSYGPPRQPTCAGRLTARGNKSAINLVL